MSFTILSVGQKMPNWCTLACHEYLKRLQRFVKCELIEIPTANRQKSQDILRLKQEEASKILQKVAKDALLIALDVKGATWCTPLLAKQITTWQLQSRPIHFVIGGPDGLCESIIQRANAKWSLSPLTFAHALARVVVLEQLYRAASLNANHPYHRE